jgi:SPP1 family predicted phage head-tail adaptor
MSKKCGCTIGKLNRKITIEELNRASDGYGGFDESWMTLETVWAKIEPISAKQRFFADKLEHNVTHIITIRYDSTLFSNLNNNQRILYDSRYFQIHGFINIKEENRYIEIMAKEGMNS